MKKLFKWVGIIVGALLAILIVGAIALPLLLPLDKIKDMATAKISEAINREVKIEKVSFNLFSGIQLEKISIANRKGFSDKPLISADGIELRYAFWPIFKRQLLIKEVRLVKPEILIEKTAGGTFNCSDMTNKKAKGKGRGQGDTEAKEEKQKQSFSLVVDSFAVKDGLITYIDQGTGAQSEIKNANLSLSGFTLALIRPIDLNFSATATYQKKNIPLSLRGKIGVDLNKQAIDFPALSLEITGEKAIISAKVSQWKTAPHVDFSISSDKLSIDPFLAIFAGGEKKAKPQKGELSKKVDQATKSISRQYSVNGRISITKLSLLDFEMDKFDCAVTLANKQVTLDIKEIALYEGTLSGQAKINLATSGLAYNINNLKLKDFNVTPFTNDLVETFLTKLKDYQDLKDKVYGKLNLSLTLNGHGVEPEDILTNAVGQGSFALTDGEIKRVKTLAEVGKFIKSNALQDDIKFKDLGASFAIKNRVLSTKDLRLDSKNIKVGFSGGADLGQLVWVSGNRLTLKLSPELTQGLPKELELLRNDQGWLEATFELTGSLKLPIPKPIFDKPIEKVIGNIKLKIDAGKVEIEKKVVDEAKKQLQDFLKF